MEGGRTAHSALQLPLNIAEQQFPVCKISGTSGRGQLLKHAKIIFWDECTMAHKKSLEAMDRTLQELRKNSEIMGGALLILSGDFRQTLPVIPKSTPADEINACLKKSHLWPKVQILQLTKNMRVELSKDETAAHFAKILLQIGEGTYPTDQTTGLIELNSDFCNIATTENELIDKIYPNIIQNYTNVEWLFQRAILATKNNIVDDINFNILKKIPGEEKVYKSIDTMSTPLSIFLHGYTVTRNVFTYERSLRRPRAYCELLCVRGKNRQVSARCDWLASNHNGFANYVLTYKIWLLSLQRAQLQLGACYKYARACFNYALPHAGTLNKWYNVVEAERGFTVESFVALKSKFNNTDAGDFSADSGDDYDPERDENKNTSTENGSSTEPDEETPPPAPSPPLGVEGLSCDPEFQ
ncbi:hypothetical protein EVAR_24090_1 [Eumeta japonica]|uniref:ATP-dependent DNA helicase n=1 Tax=Eumeta variegata TaxID=151549 RepID=A0A4C1ZTX3_EUMVA|nr:hypothetical protein EVAR_24090_1 [Eumeta japonica]